MPKAPAVLESIPNPCTKQFHTTAKPTSPYVTSTKPLTETVTSVCHTPQIKDIGVPKEIKHFTGLRNEDNDTNGRSTPHRVHAHSKEGSCDATYTLKPNYHSYVAPHTTYSPSRKNASLIPLRADTFLLLQRFPWGSVTASIQRSSPLFRAHHTRSATLHRRCPPLALSPQLHLGMNMMKVNGVQCSNHSFMFCLPPERVVFPIFTFGNWVGPITVRQPSLSTRRSVKIPRLRCFG